MPDIFDEISETNENPKRDIFDEIDNIPSRTRSLVSAPIKGALKGGHELGNLLNPLKMIFGGSEISPAQMKAIEHFLPTQDRPLEKGLERAGRIGVSAIGGPESILATGARTAGSAALGQLAEEAGAPESLQNLAELLGFASPKFSKNLSPKKSQLESVKFLRGKGLSDREIAPLLQSERKIKNLAAISQKGKKTKQLTSDIGSKLGGAYEEVKASYKGLKRPHLTGEALTKFDDAILDSLDKINPRFQRLIEKDLDALRNKGITGESLINFWQDINAVTKGQEGGKAVLGTLKKPVFQGLESIDPKLAKDFTKLNEFYAKKAFLAKKLKPGMLDQLISKGKGYATIAAIATGNFGILKGIAGKEAIAILSRELLINPRLQNLSNQMLKSLSDNRVPGALRAYEAFKKEFSKTNKEDADELPF